MGPAIVACSPSDADDSGEPAAVPDEDASVYCAPLGPHVTEICEPGYGTLAAYLAADLRKSCRGLPISTERNCLLRLSECSESAFESCNGASRIFACSSQNEECPGDLLCDTSYEECVECLEDGDCDTGSLCDEGLCIPEAYVIP
jgi:hypothetical protein